MPKNTANHQAMLLNALSHPHRVRIVEMLGEQEYCQCELAPLLKLEQSNLSRHLKVLTQAGILTSWKDGSRTNFRIADREVLALLDIALAIARKRARSNAMAFPANARMGIQVFNDMS